MFVKRLILALTAVCISGCATYQTAKNVKLISFEEDISKGKSIGPIRGEDCIWTILGYKLGGEPTLDRAFMNARQNRSSSALGDAINGTNNMQGGLKYINRVSTENTGWNAVVVGKNCLVVKGVGYK